MTTCKKENVYKYFTVLVFTTNFSFDIIVNC
jgi:hypothetical protein